jgi:hypothetical protein
LPESRERLADGPHADQPCRIVPAVRDGRTSSLLSAECFSLQAAIRVLRDLFGETPAHEYGPLELWIVRQAVVDGNATRRNANGELEPRKPLSRDTVSQMERRRQALFRWGVA